MSGYLGSKEIFASVNQAIYVCDKTKSSIVTVNLLNRGTTSARVSIAVSTSQTTPANTEWVEFNTLLEATATLERSSLMVPPGYYVVIRSDAGVISASCWGITSGATVSVTPIATQAGSTPTWVTADPLTDVYGNYAASIQLSATDSDSGQPLTYSLTSGSLPTGLTLSSTGLISGTPSAFTTNGVSEPYSATVSVSDGVTTVPKVFSITKRWSDGLTSATAGPSAEYIKSLTGTSTDGTYWINLGDGPFQVYCLMAAGGYMLTAKIPAISTPQSQWAYEGGNWFRTTPLTEDNCANISAGEGINRLYYRYRTTTGFSMGLGSATNRITFARTGVTPLVAFTGEQFDLNPQLARSNFMTWISTAGTATTNWDNQPNSNVIGMNRTDVPYAKMRFGITMNNEADNLSNDSAIGFGTVTNNDPTGIRNVAAGGHRWSPDTRYAYQGYIFIK